ncbi:RNA 3'-terminal phosphate cyclase [Protomyces lactucae-debilis]|uniref:RNA 3'-terminal phosphate cyclase n=1 Tax=Protomyces lactucae-debilis TaxID=2754530 RepID=A0A1Y2FSR3_PROLT|nr:RNA 3'-terminal phosphate cyclase [Protomyces lactucae-debilis]ORY86354.1 RNA 3'-terminal phosphate cyclase [Protomyces lactucae-debilis]
MVEIVRFEGHAHLRQRLVLATLAGRTLRFDKIRTQAENPGLLDCEISFLRLLERFTNNSVIEISYTGTALLYRPGQITGGAVEHACTGGRAVGYFLEPLLQLAPFAKQPCSLTLTGITTDNLDAGVDLIRTCMLPVLKRFVGDDLELRILKRGAAPDGGGQVQFLCPQVKSFPTLHLLQVGKVQRVRGIASSTRVSPANVNRLVAAARGVLNPLVSDVHLYTDARRGDECGLSPGFALSLVAETAQGVLYGAEQAAGPGETPEDVGDACAKSLLEQIALGGCVDRFSAPMVIIGMLLGSEDVGRCRFGKGIVDATIVTLLRDIQQLFGKQVSITEGEEDLVISCVGTGYINANRAVA